MFEKYSYMLDMIYFIYNKIYCIVIFMNLLSTNNINLKIFYFQKIHRFVLKKKQNLFSLKKQTDDCNLLDPLSTSFFKS